MNIPKIWRRAARDVTGAGGPMRIVAWGWSATDPGEAERLAREKLERMSARIAAGQDLPSRYGYGERPLREEILREIGTGERAAIVTRNAYGALILNAANVMFIDVDLSTAVEAGSAGGSRSRSWLARWFSKQPPADPMPTDPLERLRSRLQRASDSSFRIYRTAAGFRLLATERLFEPGSVESEGIMKAVDADPAFIRLCRVQQSFRARLTPKPWRCDSAPPPVAYPRAGAADEQLHEAWLAAYDASAAAYATCRFLETSGSGRVHEAVWPILEIHDGLTRATSPLDLA
jgi:hypothetical protein